jgi:hypothetical protein
MFAGIALIVSSSKYSAESHQLSAKSHPLLAFGKKMRAVLFSSTHKNGTFSV